MPPKCKACGTTHCVGDDGICAGCRPGVVWGLRLALAEVEGFRAHHKLRVERGLFPGGIMAKLANDLLTEVKGKVMALAKAEQRPAHSPPQEAPPRPDAAGPE